MSATALTITVRGRLGDNPQLRYTPSGKAVCNFNLAVDQGESYPTMWVRVTVWEKQAEAAATHLSKGDLVQATASRFQVNAYVSKDGQPLGQLEITARNVDYILTKGRSDSDLPTEGVAETEDIPF